MSITSTSRSTALALPAMVPGIRPHAMPGGQAEGQPRSGDRADRAIPDGSPSVVVTISAAGRQAEAATTTVTAAATGTTASAAIHGAHDAGAGAAPTDQRVATETDASTQASAVAVATTGAAAADEEAAETTSEATDKAADKAADKAKGGTLATDELEPAEKAVLQELKARDREVRLHEQAHLSAAGSLAMGGPSYSYQRGPDGRNYAIGGEVNISMAPGRTPEETIARAERIVAAALAPAEPSGQDRAVAARAMQMKQAALVQVAQEARQQRELEAERRTQALTEAEADGGAAGDGRVAGSQGEPAAVARVQVFARQALAAYAQTQQLGGSLHGEAHRRGSLVEMAA